LDFSSNEKPDQLSKEQDDLKLHVGKNNFYYLFCGKEKLFLHTFLCRLLSHFDFSIFEYYLIKNHCLSLFQNNMYTM
jgi:hypothetical protein